MDQINYIKKTEDYSTDYRVHHMTFLHIQLSIIFAGGKEIELNTRKKLKAKRLKPTNFISTETVKFIHPHLLTFF